MLLDFVSDLIEGVVDVHRDGFGSLGYYNIECMGKVCFVAYCKHTDTLCETFLTYISCGLMIFITVLAWHTVYYDSGIGCCGSIVTIMIFYLIFIAIGDKSRLIRARPGADRLNNH